MKVDFLHPESFMSFHTTDRDGITELNPPEQKLREILRTLNDDREDHAEVWLTHSESGWTLTAFSTGVLHFHNDLLDEPLRQLIGIDFKKALELWQALAQGRIATLKQQPWKCIDE